MKPLLVRKHGILFRSSETGNADAPKRATKASLLVYCSLDKHRKKLTEVSTIFRKLYEDNALGRITDEQFQMLSQGYVEEKKLLESDISTLEAVVDEMKNKSGNSKSFIELAKKFTDIQELTPEILHTFISKIEIHEKVKDVTTGKKTQDIDIYFTHVGKMA